MFILVYFGYRQHRIFTIDCLTASLMDYIGKLCLEDMVEIIAKREESHSKEITNLQKKLSATEKKFEKVEQQLKDEADRLKLEELQNEKANAKDAKGKAAKPPAPKKGGKEPVSNNPLEIEKAEVAKEIETIRSSIDKYSQKIVGLKDLSKKMAGYDNVVFDLVDKTGERKFTKTKLDTIANTFLSDKGSYYLVKVTPPEPNETEEKVELVQLDGAPIRTIEEDATYVEGDGVQLKGGKDAKKAKKK